MAKVNGEIVEVSNYYKDGEIVAQHVRGHGKTFKWKGDTADLPMFGQWLWSGKGKRIIITEGELDCLSISMLQQNRWPVVSLPNGVSHAPKAMRTNLEFLSGYDEIVLCFDNDDAGRAAAEKCADILPAGKVHPKHCSPHCMRRVLISPMAFSTPRTSLKGIGLISV
jgi:twinkle protein